MSTRIHTALSLGATRRRVLSSAVGTALLAACGPVMPGVTEQPTTAKEPVTLRLNGKPQTSAYVAAMATAEMRKRFPHVSVEFEGGADLHVKLGVLFSSNSIGDVVLLGGDDEGFFAFWSAQGNLTQIDPLIQRDKYDMNVFFPRAVEALKIVDGKMYCLPHAAFMGRCALFYNADMFQRRGMALPTDDWTYSDVMNAAQRLTTRGAGGAETEVWGGGRNFDGDQSFTAVTRAFGGDLYSPDGKKTLIASDQSRQAISWWLDRFLKDQSIAINPVFANPRLLFEQGKAALTMGYNPSERLGFSRLLTPAGVPWGMTLMPKGPTGRRGGAFFQAPTGMAKISKRPNEAWELMKIMSEKEPSVLMGFPDPASGQTSGSYGARRDVYTDPRVLNAPNMPPGVMATEARSMELPEPFVYSYNFRSPDAEKVINAEIGKAVRGEVQYDGGFFQNMAQQIQVILDQPR